nr:retrovirus-related Pol polyprotein from transposon TNT 1-94 [Tanacetum cinerariifolium]
ARIAQSSTLPTVVDEPASPVRDVSEGEACPTESGFIADQDRATIVKSSTLPHDLALRVTSPAADEGSIQHNISELTVLCTSLQRVKVLEDREGVAAKQSRDNAPIKGRSINEREAAAERISNDSEEIARVLTSMDAATILAEGIDVPTSSGFIPTAGPPATVISTGSEVGPTASPILTRRKGKEVMVESDTLKKKKLQEQIDAQVAKELKEQQEKENMRMNKQIARDAEVAMIHVEEELQGMVDSLDQSNETIAKYLQEYQDFSSELPLEKRIELINDLVEDFIPIGSKEETERLKRKGLNLEKEQVKKQKLSKEAPEIETSTEEVTEEKMKEMMQLVPVEDVYVQALQVKHPIIDWKALVKEYLSIRPAINDKEMELWVELKRIVKVIRSKWSAPFDCKRQRDLHASRKRLSSQKGFSTYDDQLQALGCSKHMTGDRSRLMNFMKKFIGTVRFRNDHFCAIMGYGDYVIGDSVISRVYYMEGLRHNLFFVRQFYDSDLEVAFRKHSCYVRDTDGVELIKGFRWSNLYTISVEDMMKSSPICLLFKTSKNKSWLWHWRLNHSNFGTINDLARKDLVRGLPRLKFKKDHLYSACQLGKSKKHTHKPKTKNTNLEVLNTLHMDLYGPIRVQTINGKKYILVIVDDYSRFTWVKFLRSKDETPEVVIKFIQQIQVVLNKTDRYIHTNNGTDFVNHTLTEYYECIGIFHQNTVLKTPQQNGVVQRRNRTLVKAAQTMLIFSKALMFLWQKLWLLPDIGIFVGYAPSRKGYRIYNKKTQRSMKTIHVQFDELTEPMAYVYLGTGPAPNFLTTGQIKPPRVERAVHPAQAVQAPVNSADEPTYMEDHPVAPVDNNPFVDVFASEPHSKASSSGDISSTESTYVSQTLHHLNKWSNDHDDN